MRRSSILSIPAAAVAVGLAACGGETTGPASNGFDAAEVDANLQRVERVIAAPEWESFRAVAERADVGPFASRVPGTGSGLYLIPLISPDGRGTTFIYDTVTSGYVPRFSRPGAPDNGVRFILYAVNPLTGAPEVSAEIGHADLFDLGSVSGPEIALQFIVVSESDIFLDYSVTAVGDQSGGSVSIGGFAGRSDDRLAFSVEAQSTSADATTATGVRFEIDVPERAFEVRADLASVDTEEGETGSVDIRVRYLGTTIRIQMDGGAGSAEASFLVNGELFATATGSAGGDIIRGADGQELSAEELQALHGILRLADGLTRMFGELMAPAGRLIVLAASL
jgi:hypothetical protein